MLPKSAADPSVPHRRLVVAVALDKGPGEELARVSWRRTVWRLAVEPNFGDHSWEVGTFGLASNVVPLRTSGAATDSFTDIGIDTQYQYLGDPHTVTVRAAWIREARRE